LSSIGDSQAQLTATIRKAKRGVQITADASNPSIIYVGLTGVTADSADATDGYPIAAGDTVVIPTRNPALLYVIAKTGSTGKLWWMII